jgi:hypothetical protein
MKKLIGLLLVVMMGVVACEGPMGREGQRGRDGKDGKDGESTQWWVGDFTVLTNDWVRLNDDDWYFFEYEFSFPELSNFVFTDGAVIGYLVQNVSYNGGPATRVHNLLPYTVYGEYLENGYVVSYSENYSFEVRPKYINFIVKFSDDVAPNYRPDSRTFRVVLMW